MKILICSKINDFSTKLIDRLNKEKQEVYQLTGVEQHDGTQKSKAFQLYTFDYQNKNVGRIIENIAPDVMIIAGCCDTGYRWMNTNEYSVKFVSDVSNLVMSAKNAGVRRVVFCSTSDIHKATFEETINMDKQGYSSALHIKAYQQAESICEGFKDDNCEMTILHMPEVYGELVQYEPWDVCLTMLDRYINSDIVSYHEDTKRNLLYYEDAVEVVFKLIFKQEVKGNYYISGEACTEKEIAESIKSLKLKTDVVEEKLPALPAQDEQTVSETDNILARKYNVVSGIWALNARYSAGKKKESKKTVESESVWRKIGLPIIETVVFFLVAHLITTVFKDNSVIRGLDFYLIYVAVIGGMYGLTYALFATLLSAGAKIIAAFHTVGIVNLIAEYSTLISVLQLLLVAVIAGYFADKYKRKNSDLIDENGYLSSELKDMTAINDNNAYVKSVYEKRLINNNDGLAKLYDITSSLDFMESKKVIFEAVNVIMKIMDTKDVAVYVASRSSRYFRRAAASSEKAQSLGNSMKYDEGLEYYLPLSEKEIYINRTRDLDKPVFAGATYLNDEVTAIVFVWQDKLENVNLHGSNMVALLCRLLEKAMNRAFLYEDSIRSNSYYNNTRVLLGDAFEQIFLTFKEGYERGFFQYVMLEINDISDEAIAKIQKLVRDTDVVGFVDNKLRVLLSNTTSKDIELVLKRFENEGLETLVMNKEGDGYETV